MQTCHDLLQSKDWQIQNIMSNGDIIFYINRPKEGKTLKIVVSLNGILSLYILEIFYCKIDFIRFFKGTIEAPAGILVNRLFDEIELTPSWNRLVTESKKLQVTSFLLCFIFYIFIKMINYDFLIRTLMKIQILFIKPQVPKEEALLALVISLF